MIGNQITHYLIQEKLGEGGMGIVYKAEDTRLQRTVAIKVLKPEVIGDPEAKERFIREARAASALNHPNITTIYEIDEWYGQNFIVMEYMEGQTVKEKVKSKPLSIDEVLDIAAQTAEALKEAHEHDIIHRDIKSDNIMVTEKGQVKVMDFGLAKLKGTKTLTKTDSTIGTVAYMSPEQAKGKEVDHRTDIWSFGVVLYEMITGRLPFYSDYEQAMVYSILHEQPEPITQLRTGIPKDLENIVNKALAKKLDERYQHVVEILVELKPSTHAIQPGKAKKWSTKPGHMKSKRILSYVLITMLLILFMVAGHYFLKGHKKKITSIAVLPLQNLSGDPEQEYFVEGIHDELITSLSKIRALSVISRTSVMQYKDVKKSLPEIAKELNVDAVIEGTVRRSVDQVRITVQLIDATKDRHLWANSYQHNLSNILVLQSELAQTISQEIKVKLTPREETRLAYSKQVIPEAYEAYLKGLYYYNKFTDEGLKKAVTCYEQSIRIDSTYAPAYAELAQTHSILGAFGIVPWQESINEARLTAYKALKLDSTLAKAYASIAFISQREWNWAEADRAWRRAIELSPGAIPSYEGYLTYLLELRRYEEAIEVGKRMEVLNPLSLTARTMAIWPYLYSGRYVEAMKKLRAILELDPNHHIATYNLGQAYMLIGNYKEAIAMFKKAIPLYGKNLPVPKTELAVAYALAGQTVQAFEIIDEMKEYYTTGGLISAAYLAHIYAGLGDKEQALQWFDKAFEAHDPSLPGFMRVENFLRRHLAKQLRDDSRFAALVKKVGLKP